VLAILKPIWFAKPETAKRVLQRMEAVFRFAILNEYRDKASPCTGIVDVLGTGHQIVTHHPAMPVANVPSFIRDVRAMDRVWPMTRLALEFLILTAARSGEVRGARWEEFDLEQRLWRVPPDRMKTKKPHVVPLSEPAIELIQGAGVLRGLQGLVFPGTRGRSLSDSTMSKLMRDAGLSATPHGFRSTFKDWASEAGWRDEVSEAALGHADTNRVRAAYRRTDFLTERRKLMDAWAAVALPRED